jgi:hypothetical protein
MQRLYIYPDSYCLRTINNTPLAFRQVRTRLYPTPPHKLLGVICLGVSINSLTLQPNFNRITKYENQLIFACLINGTFIKRLWLI